MQQKSHGQKLIAFYSNKRYKHSGRSKDCYQGFQSPRTSRSNRPETFYKIGGVLKNFAKSTGKHLYRSLCFSKVACNSINKETLVQVFSLYFAKFLEILFLQNTSGRPLLDLWLELSGTDNLNGMQARQASMFGDLNNWLEAEIWWLYWRKLRKPPFATYNMNTWYLQYVRLCLDLL